LIDYDQSFIDPRLTSGGFFKVFVALTREAKQGGRRY